MKNNLTGFFMCGVDRHGKTSGDEYVTTCPFCSRENKFYIHTQKSVWQCKVCGEQGNYLKFLERASHYAEQYITPEYLGILAADRKLPVEAFEQANIGCDSKQYYFPYFDYEGKFCGLRLYHLGKKPITVAGTTAQIFFLQDLAKREKEPVYICEGEGDTFAFRHLLKITNKPGVVVGIPGVNIFKDEWVDYFYNRDVICLFDNDDAGMEGEIRVHEKLSGVASSIRYLHWPLDTQRYPVKYDIRDFVSHLVIRKNKPKTAYARIQKWLETVPRKALVVSEKDKASGQLVIKEKFADVRTDVTFDEIVASFKKYLYLRDLTPIKLMLAVILANRIRSERVWMFFVAPPSNTKTEFLTALSMCPETRHITTLTDKTLVSGWTGGGKDPSLIPLLNNKILVIKDFTPILTMPPQVREVIYSQLRDIYDGSFEKVYGHNIVRSYKNIHFGVIAAVTGSIERTAAMQQTLGERFLRYSLPIDSEDLTQSSEQKIMAKNYRAFDAVTKEYDERQKVQILIRNFLQYHKPPPVVVSEEYKDRIIYLGRLVASMRGVVDRDFKERMMYKPTKEGPTRIIKQFKLLCIGLASVEGRTGINQNDYAILKKVALSSTPSRVEIIIRTLHFSAGPLKGKELIEKTRFDYNSIIPLLRDLILLDLVKETRIGTTTFYELTELSKFYISKSEVYLQPRPIRMFLKNNVDLVQQASYNGRSHNGINGNAETRENGYQFGSKNNGDEHLGKKGRGIILLRRN